ncbi:MAG TPA: general secretion pathway protein [Erysipelotrichaceae bacterium]|jgi:type II secretory pathway predicted ATPase ExeA|nr:general secretion pathway protein [Erysipelotrichaceae bacterium]
MSSSYYGLCGDPFNKHFNSAGNCFRSYDFKQMTSRLNHLKDIRGIGLFTASPGMGKSMALKYFADSLNPNLYKPIYTCLSTVTVGEFYKQLCEALGIVDVYGKSGRVNAIKDQIRYMYKEKRQTLILIIDEAQYLNTSILTDLKMLMNFDYDTVNCFALILCGEPYLSSTLNKPIHVSLKQRITVHYEYSGLQDEEVSEYIRHKIRSAGGADSIISEAAISALHGYSQGNPRIIDNIMSDALIIGEQLGKTTIDADVILAAAENRTI